MNERIKLLAEQATEYMQHGFTTQETYFDKEKFAELIVRDCVNQIKNVCERHSDQYIDAALRDAAFEIHQQFGIKE